MIQNLTVVSGQCYTTAAAAAAAAVAVTDAAEANTSLASPVTK